MTALKGTKAQILVDEFIFDSQTMTVGAEIQTTEGNSTNLASTATEAQPILPRLAITQSGYHVLKGAGYLEQELENRLATSGVTAALLLGTDTVGCPAYVIEDAFGSGMTIDTPMDNLITVAGAWTGKSGPHRGLRIYSGTISGTGTQASVDFGAQGTDGGQAYLFLSGIGGSATDAAIVVQHSSDDAAFSTKNTFTVSAEGAYSLALSGTIERYVRIFVSDMGGASYLIATVVVVVDGVTES